VRASSRASSRAGALAATENPRCTVPGTALRIGELTTCTTGAASGRSANRSGAT
jgi:hypothetical protein